MAGEPRWVHGHKPNAVCEFGMPVWLKKVTFTRLILGLCVAACLWWLCNHAGNKLLLPIATRQIQELTAAKVILKGVNFHLSGKVTINELLIQPPSTVNRRGITGKSEQYDNTIIKARGVYARFKTLSLLTLRPRLKEIIAEELLLNFQYDTNSGRWNTECFKAPQAGRVSPKWPSVIVRKGIVKCSKISSGSVEEILALDAEAQFSQARSERVYNFSIATADLSNDQLSGLKGYWLCSERSRLVLQGGLSSLRLPSSGNFWNLSNLDVDLEYDEDNVYVKKLDGRLGNNTRICLSGAVRDWANKGSFEIQARINDLFHTSEPVADSFVYNAPLLEKLGPFIKSFFAQYNPRGLIDVELKANGRLNRFSEADCLGKVICKDVSLCYEKFPYRVEVLTGSVDFTANSAVLSNLHGKHGDVEIAINGYSKNFGQNRDCRFQVTSENMLLDDELYEALDSGRKELWRAFSPSGAAQIDYRFVRRPGGWKKHTLAVQFLGGGASYQHFPYPLKNLSGRLFIESGSVRFSDIVSSYDGRKITVNGEVSGLETDGARYDVQINAEHIPIDSTLKAAMPERQKRFYEQYEADGFINVRAEVFDSEAKADAVEYIANVTVDAERLSCGMFPFSVADVSARVIVTPDLLRIEELTGRNGAGGISLSGRVWPCGQEDEKIGYCLLLSAEQLEINDDLVRVLSEGPAKVLAQFQGRGKLNISAELNNNAADDCPPYRIVVNCLGNDINFEKFSYPLKDLRGVLTITEDGIYLNDITALAAEQVPLARRGGPREDIAGLKLNGRVELDGEDFQAGQFSFSARNVLFDRWLEAVLDTVVPNVYEDISPSGRFDLDIENLRVFKTDDGRDCVDFNGKMVLKNCAFGSGQIISRLDGVLDTRWLFVEGLGLSRADVSLRAEDLEVKGKSLSKVKTEIDYDPDKGAWTTRNFVADCYGGRIAADFELRQLTNGDLVYNARLGFEGIELKEFLMHPQVRGESDQPGSEDHESEYTSGRMNGSLSVSGLSEDNSARRGRLELSISDMQVGRLSILAKMLSVLKLTAPADFAFESMFIDSYISRNQLLLEQIDIQGKAFCLRGSGRMDLLSKHIDLNFTASGPRIASEPSLLASLAEGLAPAAVEMKVTGHFEEPEIKTTTLPFIKHTLEILGSKPAAAGKRRGRN